MRKLRKSLYSSYVWTNVYSFLSIFSILINIFSPFVLSWDLIVYAQEDSSAETVSAASSDNDSNESKDVSDDTDSADVSEKSDDSAQSDQSEDSSKDDVVVEENSESDSSTESANEIQSDQSEQQQGEITEEAASDYRPEDTDTDDNDKSAIVDNNQNSTDGLGSSNINTSDNTETGGDNTGAAATTTADTANTPDTTDTTDKTDTTEVNSDSTDQENSVNSNDLALSKQELWNVDDENLSAETKDKVQIGVEYKFPLDEDVVLKFSKLPEDSARSTLKIQKVKVSDLVLPDGVIAQTEFAYDITTDMENGSFEYDLTLPKAKDADAQVAYIEKELDEVKGKQLNSSDVKEFEKKDIEQSSETVTVQDADHFTIILVATVSPLLKFDPDFASAECVDDSNGANDEPGQKDLTRMCRNLTNNNPLQIAWNWDITSLSGSNTADGCALFDTDADGLANYSLCATWDTSIKQISGSPKLYRCNDSRADRCSGSVEVSKSSSTKCSLGKSDDDPFSAGMSHPYDAKAFCEIDMDDVGGVSKAALIDVCSYPSTQPNSDPSDCILIQDNKGILAINKDVSPDDSSTYWMFTVSGPTNITRTIPGDSSTGILAPSFGTYSITESGGHSTDISKYTTTWSCLKNGQAYLSGTGTTARNIVIGKSGSVADSITCTFTNTLATSTLNVIKTVVNGTGGTKVSSDFNIKVTGTGASPSSFSGSAAGTKVTLSPGSYSVTETADSSYFAAYSTDCSGTISAGETKTCTITNTQKLGAIKFEKILSDKSDVTLWSFTVKKGDQTIGTYEDGDSVTLPIGTYTVSESGPTGYTLTSAEGACSDVQAGLATLTVTETGLEQYNVCTLTNNRDYGNLKVIKAIDWNNDGDLLDANDISSTTDWTWDIKDGEQNITSGDTRALVTGNYVITEDQKAGYEFSRWFCSNGKSSLDSGSKSDSDSGSDISSRVTTPSDQIDLSLGKEDLTCTFINTPVIYTLTGMKFIDADGDGNSDDGENGLSGWTIIAVKKINETTPINPDDPSTYILIDSTVTGLDGSYSLKVKSTEGVYYIYELNKIGWVQSYPSLGFYEMDSAKDGDTRELNFGNYKSISIDGSKWLDKNQDGVWDEGENGIPNWEITLERCTDSREDKAFNESLYDISCSLEFLDKITTDEVGHYEFTDLKPGRYKVTEETRKGYMNSTPKTVDIDLSGDPTVENHNATVDFGNYLVKPTLLITKENNTGGNSKKIGDVVKFTMTVIAQDNWVKNVVLTDLFPKGFKYNLGSWTSQSNKRGDLKENGTTAEPTYHSPGDWNLGDMEKDEVVTLTYEATIESDADDGTYKDLAWAKGEDTAKGSVLGEADELGYVDENFVGTEVAVVNDKDTPKANVDIKVTEKEEGEVLGASTSLPSTGAETSILVALIALGLLGGVLTTLGFIRKKKVLGVISSFALMLLFVVNANAGSIVVRLEKPQSSVAGTFNLAFVTLDIVGNRNISVQCLKKGPSDLDFSIFHSFDISQGGNTENCPVNDSVLSENGPYQFKVIAKAGEDSDDSEIVSVDYNGGKPGKPKYIEKDKKNSCEYDVKFKTADDGGETKYVEIYRSNEREFDADNDTKVETITIGSNETHEFTATLPSGECNKPYYAIRAFNAAGTPSSVRAEEIEVTSKTTVTKTTEENSEEKSNEGALVTGGSTVSSEGVTGDVDVVVPNQNTEQGEVAGAETSKSNDQHLSSDSGSNTENDSEKPQNMNFWYLLIAVALGTFGLYVRNKKKSPTIKRGR
jgi:LPXTG-motif cell wall-anchored protein